MRVSRMIGFRVIRSDKVKEELIVLLCQDCRIGKFDNIEMLFSLWFLASEMLTCIKEYLTPVQTSVGMLQG